MAGRGAETDDLAERALAPFLALAFGIAWGMIALLALWPATVERLFGPVSAANPLFILAVYAPAIAALLLVGGRFGLRGVGRFLSRLTLWRAPAGWYVVLLAVLPLA